MQTTENKHTTTHPTLSQQTDPVTRFGAGVTHDLVNYLAVADSYIRLLLTDADPADGTHRALTEASHAVQKSMLLARHLLRLNRTRTRRVQELFVQEIVAGMEGMLGQLVGEDVELILSCAPDAGAVRVDPQEIERVLLNLVVNARQAIAGAGAVTLLVADAPVDETDGTGSGPARYVAISVSDTGIGMDEETRAHVFDPFFTTRRDGTGIGLAIVHDIVARSHGSIKVESEPEHGTTFTVLLPRIDNSNVKETLEHDQAS
jgi:two-component system cell cycle sensor histidine kinase/response regulator CckA